jgi:hypothetical protein
VAEGRTVVARYGGYLAIVNRSVPTVSDVAPAGIADPVASAVTVAV